ncbi:MAG: ABC transporter permease [Candidatus Promineifilaceae bacterium]
MIRTRWYKVFADLWGNRGRTLVVALAIAVGVYSVGVILDARELLLREHDIDRAEALISSATVTTSPFDDDLAQRIAKIDGVSAAEGRQSADVYVYDDQDVRKDLLITSVSDFENMTVDRVTPVAGAWPPRTNEIILERLALDYLDVAIGDELYLELSNGGTKRLLIVGTGFDAQQFSPEILNISTGYVTPETMRRLGFSDEFTEMRVRVSADIEDEKELRPIVMEVEDQIENSGRPILASNVTLEGPQEAIIDTIILLLTGFGLIILFLSGFLVVNAISALITQQLQQIGVMKLIGASRLQIMVMYILTVLTYGVIAASIGIPLSLVTAQLLITEVVEDLLNLQPESLAISTQLILAQIIMGLSLPLLAGLLPVLNGTRITTRKALNDTGMQAAMDDSALTERILARIQRIRPVQRPYLLSVRNTLRHKGRLVQTLVVLIIGTALFISVLSVNRSVNATLDGFLRHHQYDVSLGMAQPYRKEALERVAMEMPGVTVVESWSIDIAKRERPDDTESNFFRVYAVPAGSVIIDPQMEEGAWLTGPGKNEIVVNSDLLDNEPDIQIGDTIRLDIGDKEFDSLVTGLIRTDSQGPAVYLNYDDYAYLTRMPGFATHVQVVTGSPKAVDQDNLRRQLFQAYEDAGFEVSSTRTAQQINDQNDLMFTIVVAVLILMALLLAAVGGLGLTTTMSINILERIREIGVLRAVGASNLSVRQIVLAEGIVIGVLSWLIGFAISFPISAFLSEEVGLALLNVPLIYEYSLPAAILWFFALMVIAVAASLGPARDAVRLTIREVLAYE